MICPHPQCNIAIRFETVTPTEAHVIDAKKKEGFDVAHGFCPECQGLIIVIRTGTYYEHDFDSRTMSEYETEIIYPRPTGRRPIPGEVPESYRLDFDEACSVLLASPKASAALSRRILQHVLRDHLKVRKQTLDKEITEFITRPGIPSQLAGAVDAIRTVGNFAAHPLKYQNTGEIVEVELGEAEWLLDVLESLFDFCFVQPSKLAARTASLNAKLAAAGKPPLK
jgi:hypothetical protein